MPGPITTNDLLDQVRDQVDEASSDNVTDSDILQAMNRGQRRAANILAKHYPDMFLASTTGTSTGTDTYSNPEAAYGRRVSHIVITRNGLEYPLTRVDFRKLHLYTSSGTVAIPSVYAVKGRSYVIKPTPTSGTTWKIYYNAAPETLVLSQGRITSVSVASTYVLLDALGSDLTVSTSSLGCYNNIVDAMTGEILVSLQANSITTSTKQVAFKTSGLTASSVYNRTIATAIPTTVAANDYVCAIQGTCVPDLPDACLDYVISYAVNEVRRRLGEPVQDDKLLLEQLEAEVKSQWAGRDIQSRINNKSRGWTR